MSKVAITGNASGTGVFTIASPNSNTDRTLNLPDAAGTIVVSGTTPSLNGITFPASQVPSADANTLDDYEEGTWTPAGISAITPGYTISSASGSYIKIGRLVQVQFEIIFSAVGANNSAVIFGGLPFTVTQSGVGIVRDNFISGAIYMLSTQGLGTSLEINSMDGITSGSQRTIRTSEGYQGTIVYTA